jgi:hypothetical protein
MPLPYFQNKLKEIQTLEERLRGFSEFLEQVEDFFYQFTGDSSYRYLQIPYDIARKLPSANQDTSKYSSDLFSSGIAWLLEYINFDNPSQVSKYFAGMLPFRDDTVRGIRMKYSEDFQQMQTFLQKAPELIRMIQSEAEYLKGGARYDPSDNWPTLQEAIQYVQKTAQGFQDIYALLTQLQDLEVKVRAMMDQQAWAANVTYGGQSEHERETKPIEILYHATAAISEVLKTGLKSRSELDGKGKLGGGVSDLVSFTTDPQIAIAIGNSLITVAKIVSKELTSQDIIERAKQQGIDLTDSPPYKDRQMSQDKMNTGWKPEGQFAYRHTDESYAFDLLRYYLGRAQSKNLLYDPWFANVDIKDLESVREEEIGVVACRVRMNNAQFEIGMQEFRVPSSDILRTKQLNVQLKSVL